jgi:hypothetical protein
MRKSSNDGTPSRPVVLLATMLIKSKTDPINKRLSTVSVIMVNISKMEVMDRWVSANSCVIADGGFATFRNPLLNTPYAQN